MYSTLAVRKNSKQAGRLIGTHQQLDRIARKNLAIFLPSQTFFPSIQDILSFEGMRGPDGLKRKSPGKDEPMHFIDPDHDDGKLWQMISDHSFNLRQALISQNHTRAAFEAAWLAHAVTDGLTPAHHSSSPSTSNDSITEQEFFQLFGIQIKGILRGPRWRDTLKNTWQYWGKNGQMSKHLAFELGVAMTMTFFPNYNFKPTLSAAELDQVDLKREFYQSLHKIAKLDLFERFCRDGWTSALATQTKQILLPEITRAIVLAWAASIPALGQSLKNKEKHD